MKKEVCGRDKFRSLRLITTCVLCLRGDMVLGYSHAHMKWIYLRAVVRVLHSLPDEYRGGTGLVDALFSPSATISGPEDIFR